MNVDIRFPIGIMFSIIGALLLLQGIITLGDAEMYSKSLGYNINLWWGLALVIFGGSFLIPAWLDAKKKPE